MSLKKTLGLGFGSTALLFLIAFIGTASATIITSPAGTTYTSTVKAESEGAVSLHNSSLGITVTCQKSTVEGKIESHGAATTAGGKVSSATFTECGTNDVTVAKAGSLELHSLGSGKGTLTSSGAEITVNSTSIGVSCTYTTSGTDVGVVTGGTPAKLAIASSTISRTGDSVFCGSSALLTGNYKATTPSTALVD